MTQLAEREWGGGGGGGGKKEEGGRETHREIMRYHIIYVVQ